MKLAQEKRGKHLVIEVLEDRIGADQAVAFREAITHSLECDSAVLLLDLSRVEFVDSSGLGSLLSILKRMPKGKELLICGANPPVRSMFKLTRLDHIFTMIPSVDAAINRQLV